MDRSDWLSIIGCARDLAAFEKTKLIYPTTNSQPLPQITPSEMIEIKVETPTVRRFATRIVKGVKVGESPAWLKDKLEAYGIRSINNVVDITNYVMVEYGQPLHAQDLAQLKKREITLRKAKKGESITTILGTTVNLDSDTDLLTSGGVPTVIMGVVGGAHTSVSNTTTDLILDSGNYDQSIIRKTSRRLKIINETVSRCDKFLSPKLCEIALDRATYLLQELCGAQVYENYDYYPHPIKPTEYKLTYSRLAKISGLSLPTSTIKSILTSLEYVITGENKDHLTVTAPYFRTDIEVEDDLIADILRINNYANLPTSPLSTPVPADITPTILTFEERLRDLLVNQGTIEQITTPLVQSNNDPKQIVLSNALSTDQNALRTSMVPKLQEIITNYSKHKINSVLIFEIGKTFSVGTRNASPVYSEHRELSVVSSDTAHNSLATLLNSLGITYSIDNTHNIIINGEPCGQLNHNYYVLLTEKLLVYSQPYSRIVSNFSHSTTRDLSLLVPQTLSYADITTALNTHTFSYQSVACKSYTKLSKLNNYLLTFTWDQTTDVDAQVKEILALLKTKLNIDSKS